MSQSQSQWGRKAQQLSILQKQGIRVPAFVVLSHSQTESTDAEQILTDLLSSTFQNHPQFFAVRSSASNEDSETQSMAGAFHTELGVSRNNILPAARRVLDSYGSGDEDDCLIIQEFIASDSAGVLFTDAGDGTCIVNAIHGLCENAVRGFPVDEYLLDSKGNITQQTIAKQKKCRFFLDGVFQERVIEEEKGTLSVQQLQTLFALGKRLQDIFGSPQDIEWCFQGNTLFVLQSRPVTRHITQEEVFYDSANIAESYSGIVLPLTFSFAENIYCHVYQNLLIASGVAPKIVQSHQAIFQNMLAHFYGRIYYNMNNWYRMMAFLPGYERNKRNLENMITSNVREEVDRTIHPSLWLRLKYLPLVCWKMLFFRRTIKKFQQEVGDMINQTERDLLEPKTYNELESIYWKLYRLLLSRWHVTVENDFLVMTYLGLLKRLLKNEEALIAVLKFENVSASQVRSLASLGRKIFSGARNGDFLQNKDFDGLWETLLSDPILQEHINNYFKRYGGRFANELKLESPDLQEDHTLFLTLLSKYAQQDSHLSNVQKVDQRAHGNFLVSWILNAFRRTASKREELRLLRSKAFSLVRKIFRSIGEQLQKDGKLIDAGDVFYLTVSEVFALTQEVLTSEGAHTIVHERKQAFESHSRLRLRSHFSCRGRPSEADVIGKGRPISSLTVLQGRGSTSGRVSGRVTLFPAFRVPIDPFDILVAEHTDPGWTPLIGLAKGMIIEHGGLLSHAAIVSRELGIPTVIGVENALSTLKNGQKVTIDGSKGTVTIHT